MGKNYSVDIYQTPDHLPRTMQERRTPPYYSEQQDDVMHLDGAPDISPQEFRAIFLAVSRQITAVKGGTTASLAHISASGVLTVAHVGDSPVNIYIQDRLTGKIISSEQISADHSAAAEEGRIRAAGGKVVRGRLEGTLALGRALGDTDLTGISHEPDIFTRDLAGALAQGHRVIITVDSDGAFDKGTSNAQRAQVFETAKGSSVAKALAMLADANGSADNISSVVASFDGLPEGNVLIGVFDGHGRDGRALSQQARQAFTQAIDIDLRRSAVQGLSGQFSAVAAPPFDDGEPPTEAPTPAAPPLYDVLRATSGKWHCALNQKGEEMTRMSLKGMSAQQTEELEAALAVNGFRPLKGASHTTGEPVMRVKGRELIERLYNLIGQDMPAEIKPVRRPAPPGMGG